MEEEEEEERVGTSTVSVRAPRSVNVCALRQRLSDRHLPAPGASAASTSKLRMCVCQRTFTVV